VRTSPIPYSRPSLSRAELRLLLRLVRQHLKAEDRDLDARMAEWSLQLALNELEREAS
jgi:hypothetical protein